MDPKSKLLRFDNVVMTAHSAGWSDIYAQRGWQLSVESIIDLSKGYWPESVVNKGVKPRRKLRMKPA